MIKVKDAFRRIGPSRKRKDTPAPIQPPIGAPCLFEEPRQKDLFTFNEVDEALNGIDQETNIPNSGSENNLTVPTFHRDSSSHSIRSLSQTTNPMKALRKNSSQKTRSAEDLITLVSKSAQKKSQKSRRAIMTHSYEPNKLLEKAMEEGYSDLVEGLVTSGQVNINKLNSEGFAPLHFATSEGNADIIQILIDCGAYIDILTTTGHSALEIAVADGSFDCAQVLIENDADQTFVLDGPLDPRCSREIKII